MCLVINWIMKNLALLDGSHSKAPLRNFRREVPANIERIDLQEAEVDNLDGYDGAIIAGSSSSVLDDEEWIRQAGQLVEEAVNQLSLPVLGVCWGSQLLAHVNGGTVERGSVRELGYRTVNQTNIKHSIFKGIEDNFTAFQSHGDYITDIPSEAELLAENNQANQAFSYKSSVGVQFHPEVDYTAAENLVSKYKNENTTENPSYSIDEWARSEQTSDILRNFVYEMVR